MNIHVSPPGSAERTTRLRTRLVRAMVGTFAVVFGATLLTVGYLNVRTAHATQDTIEAQIRQSITRKGQGLATNHALALRGLVADNAFGDVAHLVESAVRQDREMVYGLFLGADGRAWTYVPPIPAPEDLEGPSWRVPNWHELGIDAGAGRAAGPQSRQRLFKQQTVFEFSAPIDADDGAILGRIFFGLSSVPLDQALSTARHDLRRSLALTLILLGGLGVGAMLLGVVIIRNLSRRITGPLAHLTEVITAIAAGHKNERVSIGSEDEIGALGRAFNRMLEKLDDSYLRLEALNRTLEQRVNDRTAEVASRNRDMRLVLDNVNQGFLTISPSGVLAQERSGIVDTWFGPYEGPITLWEYIGRLDRGFADMLQLGHEALVDDMLPARLCIEQLPTRLRVDGRDYRFSYRSIGDEASPNGLLVVINDITEQLLRVRHEAEQGELMAMFHGFTTDRTGFLSFFEEAARMLAGLSGGDADLVTRKRLYHTLKGNAGLAGFGAVAELCHEAEDKLAEGDGAAVEAILEALVARWKVLEGTLGELVRERGRDVIDVQAREFDEVLTALRDTTPRAVWERIADWRLEPAERPLTRLADYARSLAQRLGRGDLEVSIESGGLRLDPYYWSGLWSELVHIVRNAVDHGIERGEDRRASQKPSRPHLRLATTAVGDHLVVEIEDDGRGIDWDGVKRAACAKGIACDGVEELTQALLTASVTTRDVVTATSGRGIGLASVRQRVQALGGRTTLVTAAGKGTTFRFSLPLAPANSADERLVVRNAARVDSPAVA